jgi:hypothetical protein
MSQQLTDFTLPTDVYATFDAVSLKRLIIDRLNQTSFFTDQNYAGSNITSLIDIFSFSYHILLYFLNQTSSEAIFTEAQLYENINRIVKAIDYNPVGTQTSNLTFTVSTINPNTTVSTYTIPRYSFINTNGMIYSLNADTTFTYTTSGIQPILDLGNSNLLYQGFFTEYPIINATGESFETIVLLPGSDVIVDHFSIDVYINPVATSTWEQWTRTSSLYLEDAGAKKYEVRLNENKHYEIKFGNGIIGAQLNPGDQIAVYYLKSEGAAGQVGINAINSSSMVLYSTPQFLQIFDDICDQNTLYVTDTQVNSLVFANTNTSSQFFSGETVEDIRQRAPKVFTSQYRLVTTSDYENFIIQNYGNIIADVQVVNNWKYIDGHMKYLLDTLQLSTPNGNPNILLNNILFADTCNFNNVYIYAAPIQGAANSATIRTNYLTSAQKKSIIIAIKDIKTITTETLIMDPVYIAVDLGTLDTNEELNTSVADNTQLVINRGSDSTSNVTSIQNAAYNILLNYFQASSLGQTLDITSIINSILSLNGVTSIYTQRIDNPSIRTIGLSLLLWNPIYPDLDITITSSNITFPYFKYPYLFDTTKLLNKIVVVTEPSTENTRT